MSDIYCAHCYHKNQFQGVRPTSCENCDKPFATAFKVDKPAKAAHYPRHGAAIHQSDGDVDSQEVDEFLESFSLDLRNDSGQPNQRVNKSGGVQRNLDLPTIKQVNTALGGSGGGETLQREMPDLNPSLRAEGKAESLSDIKKDYMKDMLAQAKIDQSAPAKPRRKRKSS